MFLIGLEKSIDQKCENLNAELNDTEKTDTADNPQHSLNSVRREKWANSNESLHYTHISQKAWSLLRKISTVKLSKKVGFTFKSS